jgi:hypothetical protein
MMGLGKQKFVGIDLITFSNYVIAKFYKHHDWNGAVKDMKNWWDFVKISLE